MRNKIDIEEFKISEHDKGDRYSLYAKYGGSVIAAMIAEIRPYIPPHVALHTLQTHPEFRGNGIATVFVDKLSLWTRSKDISIIKGTIIQAELLKDTPENFASYLEYIGFLVKGNSFEKII